MKIILFLILYITVVFPNESAGWVRNNNEWSEILDYSSGAVTFGIGMNGGKTFFSGSIYKAPASFKITEGSIYGIAKYRDTWRGSIIQK